MAIRTFVAAAAIAAFTTPAFADNGENIAILDDTVSTGTFFVGIGPIVAFATIAGLAIVYNDDGSVTVSTN